MINTLLEMGFDGVGEVTTDKIPFEPSLIDLCKMNNCGNYGKSYTCPPHVGVTEELIAKAKAYSKAVVFQKIYKLEDSFDIEGMAAGKEDFKDQLLKVQKLCEEKLSNFLLLGAGACGICKTCGAKEGVPCRFPHKAVASLESYSIQVSTLAPLCGMKYINGANTVTYFGAILLEAL